MRTLYIDCFAGIAGDMFLGALLDLGLDADEFRKKLSSLALGEYELQIRRGKRNGIAGTDVKVAVAPAHHDEQEDGHVHAHSHRGLKEIRAIIEGSGLSEEVKKQSLSAFQILGETEAAVHGTTPEEIHFHEVGAVDSIVDIVGSFILLEMLQADRVCSSYVNVGSGTVTCAHGVMPVPAPATARLLQGVPVFSRGEAVERTTPTGALLLRMLVQSYGPAPDGTMLACGYGLGDRQTEYPNLLRLSLIEEKGSESGAYSSGKVAVLETNIDDMNPQDYQCLSERLFAAGALDVFFTPIMMKKLRPAVRLTCISRLETREALGEIILRHSSSIGVRWSEVNRMTLRRRVEAFESTLGPVAMKFSAWGDEILHVTPEYEDLKRISLAEQQPIAAVRSRVLEEFHSKRKV